MTRKTDLTDAVALVTGAAGGIGRAAVAALAEAGATVVATDINEDASVAGAAWYASLDVTDEDAWTAMIDRIEGEQGRLDILVNNAGISLTKSIATTTLADVRRCLAINVEGMFLGTRAAQALLARSGPDRDGGSAIINLSSTAGLTGMAWMSIYSATKGAVRLFTKSAAAEFAMLKQPIRVNSVHPGAVDTGMMDEICARCVEEGVYPDDAVARASAAKTSPVGRLGLPDEIASGIAYLASPAASFMTGSELVIDGGTSAV